MADNNLQKLANALDNDIEVLGNILQIYEEEQQAIERLEMEKADIMQAIDADDYEAVKQMIEEIEALESEA